MAGVFQFGYTGKAPDGSTCCGSSNTSCSTFVGGPLADVSGVTGPNAVFCPPPPTLNYSVNGPVSGSGGQFSGTISPYNDSVYGYHWGVRFGTTLAKGTYSIRVYSDPDPCGDANDLRFDKTFTFKSDCPDNSITNGPDGYILPCNYDIIGTGSGPWYYAGCPKATPDLTITASLSNGKICQQQVYHGPPNGAGAISVVLRIPSYPFTMTYNATGPKSLPESQTDVWSGCHSVSSDWCGPPQVCPTEFPCGVWTCGNGYTGFPMPGASVSVSGGFTGQGATTAAGVAVDVVTITAWVAPKCNVTPDQLVVNWTIAHPRTVGASYSSSDRKTRRTGVYGAYQDENGQSSGLASPYGSYCGSMGPRGIGGYAGNPGDAYACGGCPQPLSKVLYNHTLGTTVTLIWNNGVWSGKGSFPHTAERCEPPDDGTYDGYPHAGDGPVEFTNFWAGLGSGSVVDPNSPGYLYACNSQGAISHCPIVDDLSRSLNCAGYNPGQASPYSSNSAVDCDPLLVSGAVSFAIFYRNKNVNDPHGYDSFYDTIQSTYSITE